MDQETVKLVKWFAGIVVSCAIMIGLVRGCITTEQVEQSIELGDKAVDLGERLVDDE